MLTVEEFRSLLKSAQALDIVDNVLLQQPAVHLQPERAQLIASALAIAYGVDVEEVKIIPMGSAHLGFSLVETRQPDRPDSQFPRLGQSRHALNRRLTDPAREPASSWLDDLEPVQPAGRF